VNKIQGQDSQLKEAAKYSLLGTGKRFRPKLIFLARKSFPQQESSLVSWAAAVEMIHTYSLIHDDLPCMDNDQFRRGLPTNHVVFGESTALLAGDMLLTDAFYILTQNYFSKPQICVELIQVLAKAAGGQGMVAGQAMDLFSKGKVLTSMQIQKLHLQKTAALIGASLQGVSILCSATQAEQLNSFAAGEKIGLAFQIADDILDVADVDQEGRSYVSLLGLQKAKDELLQISNQALQLIKLLPLPNPQLTELIHWNMTRTS
jgi:geranylgeranyl diphosphate synthase, type II